MSSSSDLHGNGVQATKSAAATVDVAQSTLCSISSSKIPTTGSTSVEQPQTKRQKIEKINKTKNKEGGNVANKCKTQQQQKGIEKDITDQTTTTSALTLSTNGNQQLLCSSLSSSAHSIATTGGSSSNNESPTSTPSSSRATSFTQLINVQSIAHILTAETGGGGGGGGGGASSGSELSSSADEVDRVAHTVQTLATTTPMTSNSSHAHKLPATTASVPQQHDILYEDMREFELSLTQQCLCGVSEDTLRKPFQSHYSFDVHGQIRVANLSEWPTHKLLQFLSNLQLLFDIYLKQNSKGFICARIMDVCDALVRNDHNLIDEIIVLANYNNKYVQFLASRVLASFLVVAKQEMDDNWLKKLVDNLFNYERLDHEAAQKIHFSLEIIKRIVEWKDVDLHPLEDEIAEGRHNLSNSAGGGVGEGVALDVSTSVQALGIPHAFMHLQPMQPTMETNYFAVHYQQNENVEENVSTRPEDQDHSRRPADGRQRSWSGASAYDEPMNEFHHNTANHHHHQQHYHDNFPYYTGTASAESNSSSATLLNSTGCHIISLTDSESFDTSHLKDITIKILENKWPALVKNMSMLITNHLEIENAENCILNFLQLWENIISVKANLSIEKTLPFYAQLHKFEFLLNQNLSCIVYKQMLCLFNEALCYASTLALQDMLPEETCKLAHQIVQHVRDLSILDSLPRRQPENIVGLLGYKRRPLTYAEGSLEGHMTVASANTNVEVHAGDVIEMDKTILQKLVLLVLKSIAVTVKEIRSDSSDSSIDSTDYDALQDMVVIERSIRDVLRKLENFIKQTLEFHPECHFSKILIHLFDDQDDHLIEAMVCTLDVTAGISFRNNAFPDLVAMLNPVYTFLEFLKMISNSSDLLLDLLVSNETCFLLYSLRFLKYIRVNWVMFVQSCHDFGMGASTLDEAMSVLIRLRLQISRLVSRQLFPYDISPVLRVLENCESLYEGNELS